MKKGELVFSQIVYLVIIITVIIVVIVAFSSLDEIKEGVLNLL